MRTPLAERANGRWHGILTAMGVPAEALRNRHGPCPICHGGKDRFRFDDQEGRGTWICSKCGAGTGTDLVMAINGWDFKTAAQEIERIIGDVEVRPVRAAPERDWRQLLNDTWNAARPVEAGDPVALYLERRCGLVDVPACIRTAAKLLYKREGSPSSYHPAMVAKILDREGMPLSLHRTYLTADGYKAPVDEAKLLMPGVTIAGKGAAVRLAPHGGKLGIAEGIETALSATALYGVPCWAVISDRLLEQWVPPDDVEELVVFGDTDESFAGQAASFALARSLFARREKIAVKSVVVHLPPAPGQDWNDLHRRQGGAAP